MRAIIGLFGDLTISRIVYCQNSVTLESTESPAKFDHRFPTVLKGYITAFAQSIGTEESKVEMSLQDK